MNRTDITILYILRSEKATTKSTAMTLKEFPLEDLKVKPNTLGKRIKKLEGDELVVKGYRDMRANTYFITEKGLKFLEREESEE